MSFRFDEQEDKHANDEQEKKEDDFALDILFLVACCL